MFGPLNSSSLSSRDSNRIERVGDMKRRRGEERETTEGGEHYQLAQQLARWYSWDLGLLIFEAGLRRKRKKRQEDEEGEEDERREKEERQR